MLAYFFLLPLGIGLYLEAFGSPSQGEVVTATHLSSLTATGTTLEALLTSGVVVPTHYKWATVGIDAIATTAETFRNPKQGDSVTAEHILGLTSTGSTEQALLNAGFFIVALPPSTSGLPPGSESGTSSIGGGRG